MTTNFQDNPHHEALTSAGWVGSTIIVNEGKGYPFEEWPMHVYTHPDRPAEQLAVLPNGNWEHRVNGQVLQWGKTSGGLKRVFRSTRKQ